MASGYKIHLGICKRPHIYIINSISYLPISQSNHYNTVTTSVITQISTVCAFGLVGLFVIPRAIQSNIAKIWLRKIYQKIGVVFWEGGATLWPLTHSPLSFYHNLAHINAVVVIHTPRCSPFNMLSNGVFYLPIHAFCFIIPYMLSNGLFYLPIHAF